MSKHLAVADAVKALVKAALPVSRVSGLSLEDAKPSTVDALGEAIVRSGDPGDPEIDLSPPVYWYERAFPIQLAAYDEPSRSAREVMAAMAFDIGQAIAADRYLGGLCIWLDATAPIEGESEMRGARPIGWTDFAIVATYSTTSPLG